MPLKYALQIVLLLFSCISFGQNLQTGTIESDTLLEINIEELLIQATRLDVSSARYPYSTKNISANEIKNASNILTPYEVLNKMSGVYIANGENFAQDLRLSIRGFGSRSAFGIRGVKVLMDGIPQTSPDGQTDTDDIDMSLIRGIDLIKTNQSALYGNASNGVIHFNTLDLALRDTTASLGATIGSYGLRRYNAHALISNNKIGFMIAGNHQSSNGYRERSELKSSLITTKLRYKYKQGFSQLYFNYVDSPIANDPGGINLDQVNEDRRSARPNNVQYQSGESISQSKIGFSNKVYLNDDFSIENNLFNVNRKFRTFLPFRNAGSVSFDRIFRGSLTKLNYQKTFSTNLEITSTLGHDYELQEDERKREDNNEGEIGELKVHQFEKFKTSGFYNTSNIRIGKASFNYAVRLDNYVISLDQQLGSINETRKYTPLTYSAGINYNPSDRIKTWVNVGTGFETPTLNELSNNPNGTGFNEISPQNSINYELGINVTPHENIKIEVVGFLSNIQNELLPYELESQPGRTFYENVGETNRKGLEFSISGNVMRTNFTAGLDISNFTFGDFILEGDDLKDNFFPGVPKSSWFIDSNVKLSKWASLSMSAKRIGQIYLTNSNDVSVKSSFVLNGKLMADIGINGGIRMKPFVGVNNALNQEYFANLRINAFGGRYYEPAAKRFLTLGVDFQF